MAQVTIGMPVFNDKDFIEKSLASILNQTFRDFVVIISDDCSTDGSAEICREFEMKDKRIRYIRQSSNLGISRNMQYLLSLAETEFFMWAGDDDLYDPNFIKYHIDSLKENPEAVSAFGGCILIDEMGNKTSEPIMIDYGNPDRSKRLKNYFKNSTDYFGYGVFRTHVIKGVEFPVWWWPNKKTPYNNIYPTLCFYLAKGDYAQVKGEPLFYKRIKSPARTHHVISFYGSAIRETLAYVIRRFNLVVFSVKMVVRGGGLLLAIQTAPYLFYFWFVVSSIEQIRLAAWSFWRNRILDTKGLKKWVP